MNRDDLDGVAEAARLLYAAGTTEGERALARAFLACSKPTAETAAACALDLAELAGVESPMLSEVVYYNAFALYMGRDYRRAQAWLLVHEPEDVLMRARFRAMDGALAAAREDYAEQARCADRVVQLLDGKLADERVRFLVANSAQTLAILAREGIAMPAGALDRLEALLPRLVGDETGARMHAHRALAWRKALAGDSSGALRDIMRSASLASTPLQRIYGALDHAQIALLAGEHAGTARAAYQEARDAAAAIEWDVVVSDDLAILPLFARTAAALGDVPSAKKYLGLARAAQTRIARRFALAHDARFKAFVDEAAALVEQAGRGNVAEAAEDAYRTFARIGFTLRAAHAIRMLMIRGSHTKWAEKLAELESAPQVLPVRQTVELARIGALHVTAQRILELVREHRKIGEIASMLDLTVHNVRYHLPRIYRAFGVRNRAELQRVLAQSRAA